MRSFVQSMTPRVALLAVSLSLVSGCSGMNRTAKGAVIGGAAGGVVGGVIGNAAGSTAKGAIIGAVVGGTAGALIGHHMDQQAREIEQNIPGARVERVGEGIQVTFDSGLLFDFDSDALRSTAQSNLNELARSFDRYPKTDLMIVGHTDDVGRDDYNQVLSERRAASAARYLGSRGVDAGRILTRGRGETEPVATNGSEAGRQQNRRVEVAIYANEAWREEARREAGS